MSKKYKKYSAANLAIVQQMVNTSEKCAASGTWEVRVMPSEVMKIVEFLIDNSINFESHCYSQLTIYFGVRER